jgi:hypothetical protein
MVVLAPQHQGRERRVARGHVGHQLVQLGVDAARVQQQPAARVGGRDAAREALEQRDPQRPLQLLHAGGHGRLREVQLARRLGDAARVDHGAQHGEVAGVEVVARGSHRF